MSLKVYAWAGLIMFIMGLMLGAYAIITKTNALTVYVLLLMAPGTVLAVANMLSNKRSSEENSIADGVSEDDNDEA